MDNKNEIDLKDIFHILKKYFRLILAVTAASAAAFFICSRFFMTPMYQAQATLIVNASSDSSKDVTYDVITTSQKLVDTYAVILKSRAILGRVIQDLGLRTSIRQLSSRIDIEAVGTTEVMNLMVKDGNAGTAKAIAAKIIELAPSEIIRTVKAGSVEIISPAETEPEAVSPNIPSLTMIGMLIGLAVSLLSVCLSELLNDKIKSREDVENKLKLTVVGVIPKVGSHERQGGFHEQ